MTTAVDLANRALTIIGTRSQIQSLTEASPEAQAVATVYASALDRALVRFPWGFARRRLVLAVVKAAAGLPQNPDGAQAAPGGGWRFACLPPADCLRLIAVEPPGTAVAAGQGRGRTPFEEGVDVDYAGAERAVILTDLPVAEATYIRRLDNPALFPPLFQTVLVAELAQDIALTLTGSVSVANGAMAAADRALSAAEEVEAATGPLSVPRRVPDAIVARHGGFGFRRFDRRGE